MDEETGTTLWGDLADAYDVIKRKAEGPTFEDFAGRAGLAAKWGELLKGKAKDLGDSGDEADLQQPLWLQGQTWALLATLTNCRHPEDETGPTAAELLRQNPYVTPMELTAAITAHDVELDEWIAIRNVLNDTSPYVVHNQSATPTTDSGFSFLAKTPSKRYLPSTQAEIKNNSNPFASSSGAGGSGGMGRAGPSNLDGPSRIARCLDLDCDVREAGVRDAGRLMPDDKAARQDLLAQLFALVRTGKVDQAAELCKKSNESWRAASLEAALPWRVSRDDEANGMDVDGTTKFSGSLNRSLWKKACSAIARNANLPEYERALYGAISGDLHSVLPVCKTWDDHLWAHVNALIETRLLETLELLGGYWQNEFGVRVHGAAGYDAIDEERSIRAATLEQVFAQLARTDKDSVADEALEPYQTAQQRIVLDQFNYLVEEFAEKIGAVRVEMDPGQANLIIAFFAHLVLYLRGIGHDVPDMAADEVLKAYIDLLKASGEDHLIALYASELTDADSGGNVEYAKFLKGMPMSATKEERRDALIRAEEQGLDIYTIARIVTAEAVKMMLYRLEGSVEAYSDSWQLSDTLSKSDADSIRALEWTTFAVGSYPDALVAANAFLRCFWCTRRLSAIKYLLESLPEGFAEECKSLEDQYENEYLEFVLHSDLKHAVDAARRATQDWKADLSQLLPKALKGELMAYTKEHGASVVAAHEVITSLLRGGWSTFRCIGGSDNRNKAWNRLRAIYTPDLLFDLHAVLLRSSLYKPQNLQSAIDLAQIVATTDGAGTHPVVQNLGMDNLLRYLKEVEKASMLALRRGAEDPLVAA